MQDLAPATIFDKILQKQVLYTPYFTTHITHIHTTHTTTFPSGKMSEKGAWHFEPSVEVDWAAELSSPSLTSICVVVRLFCVGAC